MNNILTAENVESVFLKCLFKEGEDTSNAVVGHGIVRDAGFHPQRLEAARQVVADMLRCLPLQFREEEGGGWSFLNACMTREGDQWGEHPNMEQLFTLGDALKLTAYLLPREFWGSLPGGMPYIAIKKQTP